jgi:hypothetical protein
MSAMPLAKSPIRQFANSQNAPGVLHLIIGRSVNERPLEKAH